MSLNDHWVAMSETQPWKFFALQRLNFQSLKLNFQFLEGNFKMSEPCVVWSFFHKLYEPESELARNFLVIAPNIIVLDRIYKDFKGLRVFFEDPAIPDNGVDGRNWRDDFQLTLHVQDDVRITHPTGNIFLTN